MRVWQIEICDDSECEGVLMAGRCEHCENEASKIIEVVPKEEFDHLRLAMGLWQEG